MTPNVELMRSAKASLKGNWGNAALTTFVMGLVTGASGIIGIGPLLLGGPMTVGYISFLKAVRDKREEAKLDLLFSGFSDFGRSFVAYLLMLVFVFLWSLLLYIPGIIKAFSYSMTMYIVEEDKNISGNDAIDKSMAMMKGYKWKLFCLQLRFIGWAILAMIPFGLGIFWLQPYMSMATLNFYNDVKADYYKRNNIQVEVDVIVTEE